jgi:hypothetical protein
LNNINVLLQLLEDDYDRSTEVMWYLQVPNSEG